MLQLSMKNVLTFGGAERSGGDRECKYFPIGMKARESLYKVLTVVMYSSQLPNYQLLFLYLTLFIYRLSFCL